MAQFVLDDRLAFTHPPSGGLPTSRFKQHSWDDPGDDTTNVSRFRALKRFFLILLLFVLAAVTGMYIDWVWKRPLSPRGGRYYFQRLELPVSSFRQGDEKWHEDALGGVPENGTLGSVGCAVAATAMVFQSYGIETDPQQLNWFLTAVGGYTERGWLYWERAAWLAPDRVRHVYEDLPSYQLIDSNLARGNPVIVRVRYSSGVTHFVVIAGKQGFDYLVRDPGGGAVKGLTRCASLAPTSKR